MGSPMGSSTMSIVSSMSKPKVIFFDLDGVLVDMMQCHFASLATAIRSTVGYELSKKEHDDLAGLPTRIKLAALATLKKIPQDRIDDIYSAKQWHTKEYARKHLYPYEPKMQLCKRLREDGYYLGVVSNCVRVSVDLFLGLTELAQYMTDTVSNEDCTHPKPNPDIYGCAISRMSKLLFLLDHLVILHPDTCLAIEDHPYGVAASTNAGIVTLHMQYPEITYENVTKRIEEIWS